MIQGPGYLGRYTKGDTVTWKFQLVVSDAKTQLPNPGSVLVNCFESGNTTAFNNGITLNVDYQGLTAYNEVVVDTSDSHFHAGKHYDFFLDNVGIGGTAYQYLPVGHFATIPEPADLRAVNGGSTGSTAGKLELAQLKIA